jgi:DNA invertase Pin-like site-specific DNA recombinase
MRVVAYIRESTDPAEDRPAFAQQEEIRRYAGGNGLDVVAICQDVPRPGLPLGREGYRSLLGIIASGNVEAVLLPGLATLSADVVLQEVMLRDLQRRGAPVISTEATDADLLSPSPADATRRFVRDVLARVDEYRASLGPPAPPVGAASAVGDDGVVVQLVPATGEPEPHA